MKPKNFFLNYFLILFYIKYCYNIPKEENNMITLIDLDIYSYLIIAWAILFMIALLVEINTSQLVSIWFCGGAVIAILLSIFRVHWMIQFGAFLIISILSLLLFKLIFKKKMNKKEYHTNIDSLINSEILITKDVTPNNPGQGKFRDIIWTCVSSAEIKEGEIAIIKSIEGNRLIVIKKENL